MGGVWYLWLWFQWGTTASLTQGVGVNSGKNSGLFHQLSLALLKTVSVLAVTAVVSLAAMRAAGVTQDSGHCDLRALLFSQEERL